MAVGRFQNCEPNLFQERFRVRFNLLAVLQRTGGVIRDLGVLVGLRGQIELHQREVGGDGMPYGLNLMLRALGAATHYGDAVSALDLEPVIATLRERLTSPDYIPTLLRRLLVDNPHRVRLVV